MFDVGWTELLVIGVVALLVVGPKELPALLRTLGRYMGMVKRQANEFRAQFDEAMRETEIDQIRKEVAALKSEAESTLRSAEQSVESEFKDAKGELDKVAESAKIETKADEPRALPPAGAAAEAAEPGGSTGGSNGVANGAAANGFDTAADPHAAAPDQAAKSGT